MKKAPRALEQETTQDVVRQEAGHEGQGEGPEGVKASQVGSSQEDADGDEAWEGGHEGLLSVGGGGRRVVRVDSEASPHVSA